MATLTELFQMILVLANALRSVTESDVFSKTIWDLCEQMKRTGYNKGGIGLARDLMNCMYDLFENAKLLLEYANLIRQQDRALYGYVKEQKPLTDEDLTKIEYGIWAQRDWQCFLAWYELHKRHAILELNMICGIVEEINAVYDEIMKLNANGISLQRLLEYAQEIMRIRNRMYHHLCDHLIETSKYFFDDMVIWSFCEDGYKGRKPLEVLNYRANYKPKSVFGKEPSNIILFMKSGTVEVQQISGGQRLNMHGLENSS